MMLLLKVISKMVTRALSLLRVIWYNAIVFSWHKPIPASTTIYGKIQILRTPTNLDLGRRCRLGNNVYFATSDSAEIQIGENVNLNIGCVLVATKRIEIGGGTSIAEYVSIRDQEHLMVFGKGVQGQGYKSLPIVIGNNVWIGRGVYIGPGTVIGDNCLVGANSVVHGSFPENCLIAGAPAVVKRQLENEEG